MEALLLNNNDINSLSELQPEGWNNIIPIMFSYIHSTICFPIKVVIGKQIVGIGATIIHKDTAWLGHIIVRKESRGKGIGKFITQKLIEIANAKNCLTINLIANELGTPVYEKFGFVTETEYLFFNNIKLEKMLNKECNIHKYREEYKNQILTIDKVNSNEDRSCQIENHIKNSFIYYGTQEKIIEGFYLPTFGEGLIIANSPTAGIELLKFHLQTNKRVAFPKDNTFTVSFLYSKGYKELRTAKRMTLGKRKQVKLCNIYNRISGNIG